MYAIVETGSKQFRVTQDTVFEVERLNVEEGKKVKLDKVLLISDDKEISVGTPYIKNSCVVCEVLSHFSGKKVIAFKYRKRKGSKSKIGHRQTLTRLKVQEIKIREKVNS